MHQIHGLLDKLMCRNLHEYKVAQTIGQEKPRPMKVDDDIAEDLGVLQGIG